MTVDSALNRGLVTVEELRALLPPTAAVRARLVLGLVDGRSQSPAETPERLVLRREGLRVEPQVQILGVGRVDLLVDGFVVVETDGFRYHSDRSQFREDRRRDRELATQGWVVLRFSPGGGGSVGGQRRSWTRLAPTMGACLPPRPST